MAEENRKRSPNLFIPKKLVRIMEKAVELGLTEDLEQ